MRCARRHGGSCKGSRPRAGLPKPCRPDRSNASLRECAPSARANVARREDTLVGSSDFPDLGEYKVAVLAQSRLAALSSNAAALGPIRLAEPFERLRDRSDSYLAQHGTRPKVFLACLGRAADFNARASFAKSLFESGGIEAVEGKGDNLAKRFKESGAKLACLCSSDKVYQREATARD